MRRPPPLPTSPAQDAAPEAPARPRRKDATKSGPAETVPKAPVSGSDQGAESAEHPMTSRDVWRAARARRRALRAEIRRFTQRSRRRRYLWLGGIGAVVLLIGGSVVAAYSPLFAVEKVTVVGASTLDPAVVEAALSEQVGTPLALVDASEVKAALLAFPLIETYSLEVKPPHDLTLRIVERTPVGVVRSDAGYTLVDAAGVALSTTPDQPPGQPLIDARGGIESDAFESIGLVVRSLAADVRPALAQVRATTVDDVTLTLTSGVTVMWGGPDDSAIKSRTLSTLMAQNPDARSFDVSSTGAVVVG